MKAYYITSDTHIRKRRLIADIILKYLNLKTGALEFLSGIYTHIKCDKYAFRSNVREGTVATALDHASSHIPSPFWVFVCQVIIV